MFKIGIISVHNKTGFTIEFTVAGDATARTITLPLVNNRTEGPLSYNCTVKWGDGTPDSLVTAYNDVNRIHTYAANGTYQVEITGTMEGWSFNNAGDKLKVSRIHDWGHPDRYNGFKYLRYGFYGCSNLTSLGRRIILASGTGVLSDGFSQTFRGCAFSKITTHLFKNHTSVTTDAFFSTFYNCASLASIPADLFRYNTGATTNAFSNTFNGCTSLTSIPVDLFRYNTAVTTSGFKSTFDGCTSLASIPVDLFRYNTLVSTSGFYGTFKNCMSLASIPTDLFRYNTAVTANAFRDLFYNCSLITAIPVDLFRYNTLATSNAFDNTFYGCSSITLIPTDLFRYNTAVTTSAFSGTFYGCSSITSIPTDLFRYNTTAGVSAFSETFRNCTSLTTVPIDLFRYNVNVSTNGFFATFYGCTSLATVPADLFRYNTAVVSGGFSNTFNGCTKLQLNKNIFYADGEQSTRFLNIVSDFTNCFTRTSFTGTQGTAPDIWECDYGETITLDVSPTTDWAVDDVITGQTSGATAVVVSKVSATVYKIKKHFGTFTLGEIVGVTGDPNKLADQGPTKPTFSGKPTSLNTYSGAGNSLTSLDNYASIPASWK